jgi:hypothetical protein
MADKCAPVLAIVRDGLTTSGFMTSTLAVTDGGSK